MHERDTPNPVVQLCADGMQAEGEGRAGDALRLFEEAWAKRRDDMDACIAAHYIARHQKTAQTTLDWNATALRHAEAVEDDRTCAFFPSLHLNMGWSYEQVGRQDLARKHYALAEAALAYLPDDGYGRFLRTGIRRGLARTVDASTD